MTTEAREFTLPRGERTRALELALRILEALPLERAWKIRCQVLRNERSESQNAYLWAVPYEMLMKKTGFEKDDLHEWFCGTFFGWKDKNKPKTPRNAQGVESVPIRTTTRDENGDRDVIDWNRFDDFVGLIQRFAAMKFGMLIPDPDKNYRVNREREAERKAA